jgi:hypothetical protein
MVHRVIEKGRDNSNLGRWAWTKLRGKNGITLTIISAYRPNPPSAGVMGVYAQHCKYFNSINQDICPREAFITDLTEEITKFKANGDHVVVMLDGNEDMRRGDIQCHFTNLQLRELSYKNMECNLLPPIAEIQKTSQLMVYGLLTA